MYMYNTIYYNLEKIMKYYIQSNMIMKYYIQSNIN